MLPEGDKDGGKLGEGDCDGARDGEGPGDISEIECCRYDDS